MGGPIRKQQRKEPRNPIGTLGNSEEAGQGIELEWGIFLIIPRAVQSGNETLFSFVSFPQKRDISILTSRQTIYTVKCTGQLNSQSLQ